MRRFAFSCALTSLIAIIAAPATSAQSPPSPDDVIVSATAMGTEWLGAHPSTGGDLTVRRPIWQGQGAMLVEQETAQRILRGWWPSPIADAKADAILTGLAAYLQSRAIEQVFDHRYLRLAHHVESQSYFGDSLIWSVPTLRLSRRAGLGGDRYAAVFASLERWIGEANLQGAIYEVARLSADRLTAATIVTTISDAAGQDLSWAFDGAASSADVNYAVTGMTSVDAAGCGSPCVDTTVTVTREGDGVFPALPLRVVLADGSEATARWDGRDRTKTFAFRGPSRATASHLDPDRIVALDRNPLDNDYVTPTPTNVPVSKWVARWVVWLQHTMLSYGLLA